MDDVNSTWHWNLLTGHLPSPGWFGVVKVPLQPSIRCSVGRYQVPIQTVGNVLNSEQASKCGHCSVEFPTADAR